MTKLYVEYVREISVKDLEAAYGINTYRKQLDAKYRECNSKYKTMLKDEGFKINYVVDHTQLWIPQPKSGSLIEERYSPTKWEVFMRDSLEIFNSDRVITEEVEELEEQEEVELPKMQKAYVISKKHQKAFTKKYPEEKYRLQENPGCVVINKPDHVKVPKLPKGWRVNQKFMADLAQHGDSAVIYHINNYNSKYIVYLDPDNYTEQYGSQIRTKTKHTDKVEKWVKYLLRTKNLKVIFRTPKGDMHYITKGGQQFWSELNSEFLEILEQLVMLQPVPKSLSQTVWEYNKLDNEGTKDYAIKLFKELKAYSKEMSFEDALKLYEERHIGRYQDINLDTVHDYSVYTNDYGFYIYENQGKGQSIESLITNKYLEDNGLLEERVDVDEMKEKLEQMKEDIKGIYPICKDIGLELFKRYEELDAKVSREYGIEDATGYAEWLGEDVDEDVETTVLNHIENEEIAQYVALHGATVAKFK